MLRKFYRVFLLLIILNLSTISYSEIKEIMTIDEYSKQFLDENFVLEDIKVEENSSETFDISQTQKNDIEEEEISEEKYKEEMLKAETLEKKENTKVVKEINTEASQKSDRIIEKSENIVSEKAKTSKINWTLPNNFRSVLIGDLKGNVFFSKNADNIYPLASVTKIMTLLVTFDEINAKKASLKDKVKISANVTHYGGSGIPLKAGQIYTLEDLIKASAIYSANNATYAIAEHIGKGNISNFIAKMNKKAEKLGISKDIKYFTPAGLPTRMTKKPMDAGTARAIYKLSIEALKYKKYIQIAGIKETYIHGGKIKIRNRNHLIGKEGVYGIKTGYHKEAKYNISVASKIDDIDVIVVVMGGESYTSRDKVVLDTLKIFKENYYGAKILNTKKVIGKVKVKGTNIEVPVLPDKNYELILKKGQKYRVVVNPRENIKLNIYKGENLGTYSVYVDNKVVLTGDVLAQKAVKN